MINKSLLMRIIVVACVSVSLGCATAGKDFSCAGVKQLSIGTSTEGEVIGAFGEPLKRQDRSEGNNQFQLLTYSYAKGTPSSGKARHLTTEFKDGVLNSYISFSALEEDSRDFKIETANKAREKATKIAEIVNVMGYPNGEVHFPSILLKSEFGSMPEVVPPPDAASAILYMHLEVKREDNLINKYLKLFVVYARPDGSIIETRHFNGML